MFVFRHVPVEGLMPTRPVPLGGLMSTRPIPVDGLIPTRQIPVGGLISTRHVPVEGLMPTRHMSGPLCGLAVLPASGPTLGRFPSIPFPACINMSAYCRVLQEFCRGQYPVQAQFPVKIKQQSNLVQSIYHTIYR